MYVSSSVPLLQQLLPFTTRTIIIYIEIIFSMDQDDNNNNNDDDRQMLTLIVKTAAKHFRYDALLSRQLSVFLGARVLTRDIVLYRIRTVLFRHDYNYDSDAFECCVFVLSRCPRIALYISRIVRLCTFDSETIAPGHMRGFMRYCVSSDDTNNVRTQFDKSFVDVGVGVLLHFR